jgi:hypothetical protein
MIRQQKRHRELMKVIETDEGIDIMYEIPITLNPEVVHVDDYGEKLADLCEKARSAELTVSVVDSCLRLVAISQKKYEEQGNTGIAHLLYHMQFEASECTLATGCKDELQKVETIYPFVDLLQLNLYAMWPPPFFLWLPENLVLDLLFGRITIFAQLDYTKLFSMARSEGLEMRWVLPPELNKIQGSHRLGREIPGSPGAIGVKLLADQSGKEQFILIGYLSRMLLEFMSPSQFLKLVTKDFEFSHAQLPTT